MTLKKSLLAAGVVAAITLGTSALALAHGPGGTSDNPYYGWHYGWHMGPMMGQGMGPGYGMGQGMGPGYGMGPGMGPGYGMGPGMMGQGMGPGYGMGQGIGPGMMQAPPDDLTAAEVRHMMEHRLAWQGNPNVKVGNVEEIDDDTIVAEIVTQDGSLVQKLEVDRHTGWMQPVQ